MFQSHVGLALALALFLTWHLSVSFCAEHAPAGQGAGRVLLRHDLATTLDDLPGVWEVPLSHYAWSEVVDSMEDLFEAALGPETAYWRTRGVTCEDVVDTVSRLHNIFLDTVKVVLIRNNTWRFLHPAAAGGSSSSSSRGKSASAQEQAGSQTAKGAGGAAGGTGSKTGSGKGSKYAWPDLVATPLGECPSPCQAQLQGVYDTVARRLHRAARGGAAPAPGDPPYSLPDMVFVINAADNMQRFGLHSRAPVLSLLKRWEVPWWRGDNTTAPRLGRTHPGGELLQAMPLPSRVQQALEGRDVSAAAAADATADADVAGQLEGSTVGARARAVGADGVGMRTGGSGVRRTSKRRKNAKSRPGARRALLQQTTWREAAAAAGRAHGPGGGVLSSEPGEGGVAAVAGASGLATHSAERSRGLRETRRGGAGTAGGGAAAAGAGAGAEEAAPSSSSSGGGAGGGDKLWDMVRRFVASRTAAHLPPGVTPPDRAASPPPPGRRGHEPRKPPYDLDLLLPTMAFVPRTLVSFPWERKKDVAFFSGVPFCPLYVDPHRICPRVFLANLSTLHPEALDVRLVRPWVNKRLGAVGVFRKPVTLPQHPPTPMPAHARYRWLLNVDGLSASTRMGFLMTTDSVILKSRSPFIEYYSRLQTPGSHYLEFWSNASDPYDILGVLAAARDTAAADPAAVAAAVRANQAIAARYIALQPKLLYARAALLAYHALVPDMAECVADLVESMEAGSRFTENRGL